LFQFRRGAEGARTRMRVPHTFNFCIFIIFLQIKIINNTQNTTNLKFFNYKILQILLTGFLGININRIFGKNITDIINRFLVKILQILLTDFGKNITDIINRFLVKIYTIKL